MNIIWSKRAESRIDEIFSYICEDDPQAALHVCERIEGRVSALAQFPYSGRIGRVEDTRELVIAGLPYIVAYEVLEDVIYILTVRHTAQQWPEDFDG